MSRGCKEGVCSRRTCLLANSPARPHPATSLFPDATRPSFVCVLDSTSLEHWVQRIRKEQKTSKQKTSKQSKKHQNISEPSRHLEIICLLSSFERRSYLCNYPFAARHGKLSIAACRLNSNLSNPKPGHTTGGSGRDGTAEQRGSAGLDRTGCR